MSTLWHHCPCSSRGMWVRNVTSCLFIPMSTNTYLQKHEMGLHNWGRRGRGQTWSVREVCWEKEDQFIRASWTLKKISKSRLRREIEKGFKRKTRRRGRGEEGWRGRVSTRVEMENWAMCLLYHVFRNIGVPGIMCLRTHAEIRSGQADPFQQFGLRRGAVTCKHGLFFLTGTQSPLK